MRLNSEVPAEGQKVFLWVVCTDEHELENHPEFEIQLPGSGEREFNEKVHTFVEGDIGSIAGCEEPTASQSASKQKEQD